MTGLEATILAALDERRQIPPITASRPDFSLDDAYAVADGVMAARNARGEAVAGWKIGFTNRTIWDEYGVHAPIWGPMYEGTIRRPAFDGSRAEADPDLFIEPRIEPEIVFRISRTPLPGMDEATLLGCIDAIGHGFEIVQSLYPDWRFAAADTVAAVALHGTLFHGPLEPISAHDHAEWLSRLASFTVELQCDGVTVDRGSSANVLGGPLSALRHFVDGIAARPMRRGIEAGDIVTTGTLTRAFPVALGETWTTRLDGLPLPGLYLRLASRFGDAVGAWIDRAAQARFLFENPAASADADTYENAVEASVEAETAMARLLSGDPAALKEVREDVSRRVVLLQRAWKAGSGS